MVGSPDENTDICKNCGATLPYHIKDWPRDILQICPACGFSIKGSSRWGSRKGSLRSDRKNPVLAAVLTLVWPGLGQAYNGEYFKAILIFIAELIGFIYTPVILISILAILFGMVDAYRTSNNMNIGNVPYKETRLLNVAVYIVIVLIISVFILRISGTHYVFF